MGTALVTARFSSPEALRRASGRLRQKAAEVGTGPNGKDMLRVDDRTGVISFGQDKTEVTEKDVWAVNPLSFTHGWIAFYDSEVMQTTSGRPADITLSLYDADAPTYAELEELDYTPPKVRAGQQQETPPDWREKLGVEMLCIEGPNVGAEIVWMPTSFGGRRTIAKLFEMVANQLDSDDPELCVPIVELFSDHYWNKRFKRDVHGIETYFIEWDDMAGSGIQAAEEAGRERAREAQKAKAPAPTKHPQRGETSRRGDPIDTRKASRSRDAEDAEVVEEEQPVRGRTKLTDDELRAKGREAREDRQAPRGRAAAVEPADDRYDPEAEQPEADEAPVRGRGGRGGTRAAPPAEAPRGRGGRAPRDEDEGVADPQPVARGRRGGRDAPAAEPEAERGAVRGRNAGRGGRR